MKVLLTTIVFLAASVNAREAQAPSDGLVTDIDSTPQTASLECSGSEAEVAGGGMIERVTAQLRRIIGGYAGVYFEVNPIRRRYQGMVPIPAGTFEMGRHLGNGFSDELPVHAVYLDAFYMDVYEVTNEKYASYLNTAYRQGRVTVSGGAVYQVGGAGESLCHTTESSIFDVITWDGSSFGVPALKEEHPMVEVSWYGACAYANQRSRDDGLTPCYDESDWSCDFGADGYRLPTEAEWEYAARGGQHDPYTIFPWGNDIVGTVANYLGSGDPFESGPTYPWTTPVGYYNGHQSPPGADMVNGYGLYDMSGNVREWCWDWWGAYSSLPIVNNPTGPTWGYFRVNRGGDWGHDPSTMRTADRDGYSPRARDYTVGFRLVAPRQ